MGKRHGYAMTIDMLPCNVLLDIFHLDISSSGYNPWGWLRLVHVCRRWRQIILASPQRLNLRIFCKTGTPVRKNLGIWPAIPTCIYYGDISSDDEDNIMAALEHPDRLSDVRFVNIAGSQLLFFFFLNSFVYRGSKLVQNQSLHADDPFVRKLPTLP